MQEEGLREAVRQGGEAASPGGVAPGEAVGQAGEGGGSGFGEMLMYHMGDQRVVELPGWKWELPQWDPIRLGALSIDLSPTKHMVFLCIAAVVVLFIFIPVARAMERSYRGGAPRGLANAMEALVLFFRDRVARPNIGHGADAYTPFILTLFFFIFTANVLGLVPWGDTATRNLSVTAGLALGSLIGIEVSGFLTLGPKGYARTIFYMPKGLGPVAGVMLISILTPVEVIGKLTKPSALALRLFANMTAGHLVMLSVLGVIFVFADQPVARWGAAAGSVGLSMFLTVLKLVVSVLQAYIFATLTSIFIGLIRHPH